MKKVILISTALVMVLSGVAAVSAYEAHIINVTAKVENALTVSPDEDWDLGTIFPQEFFVKHYTVSLSTSFLAQKWVTEYVEEGRVNAVEIEFWAEEKEKTPYDPGDPEAEPPVPPTAATYYSWMGEFIKLGTAIVDDMTDTATKGAGPTAGADGNINFADTGWSSPVGPRPAGTAPVVKSVLTGRVLGIQPNGLDQVDSFALSIGVDAPVFLPFYNYETDVCPKPNGLDVPTWQVPVDDPRNNAGLGDDFGLDIKVQVVDIYLQPYLGSPPG